MALTRSAGARKDTVRGTAPIEVRKAAASRWSTTGVVAGGASPLVVGTAGFAYSVGAAGFVTSRGASDGVHEFTNDGALSVTCPTAPGSGLSRIDIIYVLHPAAGENGDTSSQPILGVASGAAASSSPAVPSIPTGALDLARNTMTSAATTTASAGNTIAQTAAVASLRAGLTTNATGITYVAPWSVFGTQCTLQGGLVTLNFRVDKSSAAASGDWMFTLPTGFRPVATFFSGAAIGTSNAPATFSINTAGEAVLYTGGITGALTVSGSITFRAA